LAALRPICDNCGRIATTDANRLRRPQGRLPLRRGRRGAQRNGGLRHERRRAASSRQAHLARRVGRTLENPRRHLRALWQGALRRRRLLRHLQSHLEGDLRLRAAAACPLRAHPRRGRQDVEVQGQRDGACHAPRGAAPRGRPLLLLPHRPNKHKDFDPREKLLPLVEEYERTQGIAAGRAAPRAPRTPRPFAARLRSPRSPPPTPVDYGDVPFGHLVLLAELTHSEREAADVLARTGFPTPSTRRASSCSPCGWPSRAATSSGGCRRKSATRSFRNLRRALASVPHAWRAYLLALPNASPKALDPGVHPQRRV